MKIGDLIRWRSTGCHGVITKIEETASGLFIHMLCSADEDGDGGGEIRAFHHDHVRNSAEVISGGR
jgi:hypothetical protein